MEGRRRRRAVMRKGKGREERKLMRMRRWTRTPQEWMSQGCKREGKWRWRMTWRMMKLTGRTRRRKMLRSIILLAFKWTLSESKETTEFVQSSLYTSYEITSQRLMSCGGSSSSTQQTTKPAPQVKNQSV